ncbi:MAG: hypothetical protein ACI3YD_01840 [Alloprevotella sp.]
MNNLSKLSCAVCLAAAATMQGAAQTNGSNSPYSRYGFGLLAEGGNAFNKAMAGTAYGMADGKELNTLNPASYASIDSLSFLFDFGMSLQNANVGLGGTKTNAKNSSIDYMTAGFRLAPKLGMSVGMVPFSTIGYNTTSDKQFSSGNDDITQTTTFEGDGGLHEVYVGLGWAPTKTLSLGANVGYLWGEVSHQVLMSFDDTNISSTQQIYSADIRSYKLDLGLQYQLELDRKNRLVLGLVYGLGHDMNRPAYYYNRKITSNSVSAADTLKAADAFGLPHTLGVGVTWAHGRSLRVGLDYTFQKWGNVKYPSIVTEGGVPRYVGMKGSFTDRHRASIGMEYVQNPEGVKWRNRVRYRLGFAFSTPYIKVDGKDGPQDFLASMGVAMPITNRNNNRSLINFSLQYEHVKPQFAGQVTENYFRFCIGLSFNERWFMKWKAE